ncbi:hypothetical protein [Amycolatopsis magusensis]|uniref:hypothetical protein n=1 Tax=Amycolatopsis magusensis TaxID=882444 RepID=UPI003C2F7097
MSADEVIACSRCGARRGADPAEAMTWSTQVDRGVRRWLCPNCSRNHVRDIEGKLPDEYW